MNPTWGQASPRPSSATHKIEPGAAAPTVPQIRWVLLGIVLLLMSTDVLCMPTIEYLSTRSSPSWVYLGFAGFISGLVVGQVTLVASWCAFGRIPFIPRFLISLSLIGFGTSSWLVGFRLAEEPIPIQLSLSVFFFITLGFLLITAAQMLIRRFLNWTIWHGSQANDIGSRQFTIRDILIWTSVVALQVTVAKLVGTQDNAIRMPFSFFGQATIFVLGISMSVAMIGIPSCLAVLGTRSTAKMSILVLLSILLVTPLTVYIFSRFLIGFRPTVTQAFELLTFFGGGALGIMTVIYCVLGVLRRKGYRIGNIDEEGRGSIRSGVLLTQRVSLLLFGLMVCLTFGTAIPFLNSDEIDWCVMSPVLMLGTQAFFIGCLIHSVLTSSKRSTLLFFLLVAIFSFAVEAIGVSTGYPFGYYHYHAEISPKIAGVPLFIPLSWSVLSYGPVVFLRSSWRESNGNTHKSAARIVTLAACSALGLVSADLFLDPLAVTVDAWTWRDGGIYFEIPITNFIGWFIVGLLIYTPYYSLIRVNLNKEDWRQIAVHDACFVALSAVLVGLAMVAVWIRLRSMLPIFLTIMTFGSMVVHWYWQTIPLLRSAKKDQMP